MSTVLVVAAIGGGLRLVGGAAVAFWRDPPTPDPPDRLPDASVVVTAYDEADVLPATLSACRELDYPDDRLEILVCYETASTDGTAAIAEAEAAADPQVLAIERTDTPAGKAAVTNVGLDRATGDVVAVLDADQRLAPGALRRAVGHLQADGVRCVTGRRFGCNPAASLPALFATVEHHVAERVEFVARDRLGLFTIFTGGQAFFDASVFEEVGPFDESVLLEDVDAAWRIQAAGGEIRVDPAIVSFERNPSSVRALWSQRVRWARGGMQVTRTRLPTLLAVGPMQPRTRLDAAATFGALLAVPLLLLATPSLLAGVAGVDVSPLLPSWWPLALGLLGFGGPFAAFVGVATADRFQGRSHGTSEFLAAGTLPFFWALQSLAILRAFLDEFVRDQATVYVTS